jgi:hypothetical protein
MGALFYSGHMYNFEIIMKRRIFWYPIQPIKEKKISSHRRVSVYFLGTKKSKMEATTQYFKNGFYKQVLEFW